MSTFDDKMRAALAADSDEEANAILRGESWERITDWLRTVNQTGRAPRKTTPWGELVCPTCGGIGVGSCVC